jgi:sulfur carrier protein ThiS
MISLKHHYTVTIGEENRLADFLSRWQTQEKYAVMFNQSIAKNIYEEIKVEKCHFDEPEFITFTDASLSQKNKIFFP